MRKPSEILRAAQERIRDPKHWCQRDYATDANGVRVIAQSESAVCWCARGSLRKELSFDLLGEFDYGTNEMTPALHLLYDALPVVRKGCSVVTINDEYGHDEVMRLYDIAIALAEAKEKEEPR